jgi:3-oxoadipate enol-lactonase
MTVIAAPGSPSDPIDHLMVDDGCRIAIHIDGPADAPPLLLSNSLGTTFRMWDAQIPALSAAFRVIRYDSRGHGQSDAPAGDYSIALLAADALAVLDSLQIETCAFVGLSKGGMVGQWLGAHAPQRLTRLVLANTAAWMGPAQAWQTRIETVNAAGMATITEAVLERWFTPGFRERAPEAVAPVRDMLLATAPQGYAGCCAAIRDMDQRGSLPAIHVPTLVIGGLQDPATPPANSEEIAEGVPGARLVMLDAAHLSNIEQPQAFTASLLEFL